MKFSLLRIGQQFKYQGKRYVKTTPAIAKDLDSGEQRLIPRSATLDIMDSGEATHQQPVPASLDAEKVNTALQHFHTEVDHCMLRLKGTIDDAIYEEIITHLEKAREAFLKDIGL